MARTVEDCALVLAAIDGFDRDDPSSIAMPYAFDAARPVAGLKVGYDPAWFDAGVYADRLALEAVRGLHVDLQGITLPDLPWDALVPILLAEAGAAFEALTLNNQDDQLSNQLDDAWPNTFRAARFLSAIDHIQADRLRRVAMLAMAEAFAKVDGIIGPSFGPMLTITNFTGHPALTLRTGFLKIDELRFDFEPVEPLPKLEKARRVPHGITLWGRLADEGTLLSLGMALERAAGVWDERPPIG
jgi:Asp-tRNA(Asn)/Glu-tRNA(Gln) amidotransferase A subunit family amidase